MKILLIGKAKDRSSFIDDFAGEKINGQEIEFIEKTAPVLIAKPYIEADLAVFIDEMNADCVSKLKIPVAFYIADGYESPFDFLKNQLKFEKELGTQAKQTRFFQPKPAEVERPAQRSAQVERPEQRPAQMERRASYDSDSDIGCCTCTQGEADLLCMFCCFSFGNALASGLRR